MIISLIAAMDENRAIGYNNKLPWSLPSELRYFRETTKGKPVIMGRRTFESIGRPMPERLNIIVTRDRNYKAGDCIVVNNVEDALNAAKGSSEIMVIGGAQIYKEFLPRAHRMYLTLIDAEFEGDAYFPEYDKNEWKIINKEDNEHNGLRYSFVDLERK